MSAVEPLLEGDVVSGRREATEDAISARLERVSALYLIRGATARAVLFAGALAVLFATVFGIAVVSGDAMRPTAGDGDIALFFRLNGTYQPDDLVVYEHDGRQYLGRVVAGSGTQVEVSDEGDLVLNGAVQDRRFGQVTMPATDGVTYPVTVPPGTVFVLGDDRGAARDSREFGPIGEDDVQGTVFCLLRGRGL